MTPLPSHLRRAVLLGLVALALAACTSNQPIPTSPSKTMVREVQPDHGRVGIPPRAAAAHQPTVVAVCYNGMVNDDAEVLAEAALACPEGKLTLRDDDVFWTRCPLLQPQRANFICVPATAPQTLAPAQ